MKIDTTVKSVPASRSKEVRASKGSAQSGAAHSAAVSDNVHLTSTSGKLSELEAQLAGVDVADSGKIEAVRQAIDDGSFVVDEEVVAENLIQESIDNITHHPRT